MLQKAGRGHSLGFTTLVFGGKITLLTTQSAFNCKLHCNHIFIQYCKLQALFATHIYDQFTNVCRRIVQGKGVLI